MTNVGALSSIHNVRPCTRQHNHPRAHNFEFHLRPSALPKLSLPRKLARTKQTARITAETAGKGPAESESQNSMEEGEENKDSSARSPTPAIADDQEFSPGEAKDYLECYWFISVEGKVVVEPPAGGDHEGKERAVVWPVKTNFTLKTFTTDGKKREAFKSEKYFLIKQHYKKWSKSNHWDEHEQIAALFKQDNLTATVLKSKPSE